MKSIFVTRGGRSSLVALACLAAAIAPGVARADDAKELLRSMSDYLASQQAISFNYQSALEAVTPQFEKLQFVSSGSVTMQRPDKLRVTRTGGFVDMELAFDGKALTVHGKDMDVYARADASGSIDDLINRLDETGAEAPGADLLLSNVFDPLMDGVTEAKHIASAVVHGVECEYLAFRTPNFDWQIWIQAGEKPVPLRYVVTSKHVVQAPEYTIELRDFRSGADVAAASFEIDIPASAKKVDLSEIKQLDELPTQTIEGETK